MVTLKMTRDQAEALYDAAILSLKAKTTRDFDFLYCAAVWIRVDCGMSSNEDFAREIVNREIGL